MTGSANGIILQQTNTANASAVSVTTGGNVTGQGSADSFVPAPYATQQTTLGADNRSGFGVLALNAGTGTLTVTTAGGTIQSGSSNGIDARNAGALLTVMNSDALRHADAVTGGTGLKAINTGAGGVSVTNSNTIGATGGSFATGISVQGAGAGVVSVANSASITASTTGISATSTGSGAVSITNQNGGVIDSGGRGVSLGAAGTVINQLGGIIRHTGTADNGVGNGAGVYASGNLVLTNAGTITTAAGGANDAVTVLGVATITNTGTRDNSGNLTDGLIRASSASGLALVGAGSSVVNSGTIQGGSSLQYGYGIALTASGTLTNQSGGLVTGSFGGVRAGGATTITNDGMISASLGGQGIVFQAGGTINNGRAGNTTATITAANGSAIDNTGSAETIVNNYGRIQGTGFSGAGQSGGTGAFTLNNLGTASIVYGTGNLGVFNVGSGALTVRNEGLIVSGGTAASNAGISASGTATITNSGTIGVGSVSNTGVFTASTTSSANAVALAAGGTVTNSGTVTGNHGIYSTGGSVTVTNTAVRDGTGMLIGGIITGTQDGINLQSGAGALTLINSGRVAATTTGVAGIYLGSNNAHSITNSGSLSGGNNTGFGYGINASAGTLTLTNQSGGTIDSASGGAGALLLSSSGAATVTLDQGSTVTGQILSQNSGARTLVVNGTLNGAYNGGTGNGVVNFTLGASGRMQGATFGGANDTFNYQGGAVGGAINAGAGTDALISALGTNGTGALNQSNMSNFESYTHQSGTLTLTGSYAGSLATTVTGGRLVAQNTGGAFGTGTNTVAIGTNTTVELSNTTGANISYAGTTFSGAGTLQKTGPDQVSFGQGAATNISLSAGGLIDVQNGTLSGSNNGNGIWTNNQGRLNIASGANFDGVEGTINVDALTGAGTLEGGYNGGTRTTTVGVAGGTGLFSGVIKDSSGPLALAKAGAGTQTLSGLNTYSGLTTISAGTLVAANASALGGTTAGTTVANGASLTIAGVAVGAESVTLNGGTALTGTGTASLAGPVALASTSTVTAATGDVLTLSGVVSGSGGLNKAGAGTLILTGADTYTGTTTVTAGTLLVNGSLAASSAITVASGASLSGTGTIAGTVTVGGTISAGSGVGTLTTGSLTLSTANGGNPIFHEDVASSTVADHIFVRGTVSLAGLLDFSTPTDFAAVVGQNLTIIDNDGTADAVTGRFTSLHVNGATVALAANDTFSLQGHSYLIDYHGGDGNDVAIRDITPGPTQPTQPTQPNQPTQPTGPTPQPNNAPFFGETVTDTSSPVGASAGPVYGLYKAVLGRTPDLLGLESFTTAIENGATLNDVANALLGSPEASAGPNAATDPNGFVQSVYQKLLGRAADASGLQTFTNELAAGVSPATVVVQLATSGEAQSVLASTFQGGVYVPDASEANVARLYYGLLGRAPDANGLQSLSAFVENGGGGAAGEAARLAQAATTILNSTEYAGRNPSGSDLAFVNGLYQGALGRSPEAGGAAFYIDQLAHGVSRATVTLEIAQSPEAQIHLVGVIEGGYQLSM